MPKRKPRLRCLPVRFILTTQLAGADRGGRKAPDAVELRPPFYRSPPLSLFLLLWTDRSFSNFLLPLLRGYAPLPPQPPLPTPTPPLLPRLYRLCLWRNFRKTASPRRSVKRRGYCPREESLSDPSIASNLHESPSKDGNSDRSLEPEEKSTRNHCHATCRSVVFPSNGLPSGRPLPSTYTLLTLPLTLR